LKRKYCLSLLLVLVMLVAAGCGSTGTAKQSKVIGSVNGDEITQAEYDNSYKVASLYYEQQIAQFSANNSGVKISGVKTPEVIEQLKKQAWENVVIQKLVMQQAPQEGVEVADKELDQITNNDSYKKFVTENKLDGDVYREFIKTQYLYNGLESKIIKRVELSDQEIEAYYKAHPDEFQEAGGIETYHILVKTEKEADDIMAQLKNGADFAALAKKYSLDSSKDQGGYVGLTNQDSEWVPEFKKAALALKPGEITPAPVKSQFGYHIIKAGALKEAKPISLTQAHNQISMKLQKQKEQEAFTKYMADLKKKAVIKDYRAKDTTKTETTGKTTPAK